MPKPIEALARGLRVLDTLQEDACPQALSRLHADTGIPKASLLSILHTLQLEGLVEDHNGKWAIASEWLLKIQIYSTRRLLALDQLRRSHNDAS